MKTFLKTLLLISIVFLMTSCSYIFERKEKEPFKPQLILTGFVYETKAEQGLNMKYYVVVIDSCKNQTTFRTSQDNFNSLESGDEVKVYTTDNEKKFEVKKFKNRYE